MESSWVSVWTTAPSNYYQLGSDARFRVGRHQTKRRPEASLGENCSDSSLGIISGLKPTCSQDLIGCAENLLCALFGDRVRIGQRGADGGKAAGQRECRRVQQAPDSAPGT